VACAFLLILPYLLSLLYRVVDPVSTLMLWRWATRFPSRAGGDADRFLGADTVTHRDCRRGRAFSAAIMELISMNCAAW